MTFIKLSLVNAHSVGSFFGCQNLPAVFGAAEVGDQFIFCFTQLSLIIKGAVSRESSPFCLILRITRPQLL